MVSEIFQHFFILKTHYNYTFINDFKNGEIVDKQIGAVPKSVLAEKLNKQL